MSAAPDARPLARTAWTNSPCTRHVTAGWARRSCASCGHSRPLPLASGVSEASLRMSGAPDAWPLAEAAILLTAPERSDDRSMGGFLLCVERSFAPIAIGQPHLRRALTDDRGLPSMSAGPHATANSVCTLQLAGAPLPWHRAHQLWMPAAACRPIPTAALRRGWTGMGAGTTAGSKLPTPRTPRHARERRGGARLARARVRGLSPPAWLLAAVYARSILSHLHYTCPARRTASRYRRSTRE